MLVLGGLLVELELSTKLIWSPAVELAVGRGGLKPPTTVIPIKPPYKFEEEEEGKEGQEEEEEEAAPPAVNPTSTAAGR
jgi:hypothetical protein